MTSPTACPSCGAVLDPDADRCDLCGTMRDDAPALDAPFDEAPAAAVPATERPAPERVSVPAPPPVASPTECGLCGHLNPAGSRFCNQCGATLAVVRPARQAPPPADVLPPTDAPPPTLPAGAVQTAPAFQTAPATAAPGVRPPSDPARRALFYVGVGLAVVLGLYLLTQASQRSAPAAETAAEPPRLAATPVALPDSLADRVARLEDEGTARSLNDAGGVLYRAAAARPPDDPQRAALAQRAVDLYDRSLALADDPDVRVNLAVAALLDPRNPMRAVEELQAVLNASPDHVEANFNMGLMRMQIGRLDAAAASFRRVIELTPPGDPVHRQATEALAAVEAAMAQQGVGG